jgi:hypothetical protein
MLIESNRPKGSGAGLSIWRLRLLLRCRIAEGTGLACRAAGYWLRSYWVIDEREDYFV